MAKQSQRNINITMDRSINGTTITDTVIASAGNGVANEVFVLKQSKTSLTFDHVATVAEMTSLGILPASDYRTSSIVRAFSTQALADQAWKDLQTNVNNLIIALNQLPLNTTAVTVTCSG